jgi:hypothetical protein
LVLGQGFLNYSFLSESVVWNGARGIREHRHGIVLSEIVSDRSWKIPGSLPGFYLFVGAVVVRVCCLVRFFEKITDEDLVSSASRTAVCLEPLPSLWNVQQRRFVFCVQCFEVLGGRVWSIVQIVRSGRGIDQLLLGIMNFTSQRVCQSNQ